MKNQYHFIIDQSGSMANCQKTTIKSINDQFSSLKQLSSEEKNQEFKTSLHFFNDHLRTIINNQYPKNISRLRASDYCPNGNTALYDAIGTVASAERIKSAEEVMSGQTRVVFVIITDGNENYSLLFNSENIGKLIHQMQGEGYTFMFLSAIINAKHVAKTINIKNEHAHSFEKTEIPELFKRISSSLVGLAKRKKNWNNFKN
jgi:hypothetical protein